jgi:CTP:molybdopterin cytidylyltransferase MocA
LRRFIHASRLSSVKRGGNAQTRKTDSCGYVSAKLLASDVAMSRDKPTPTLLVLAGTRPGGDPLAQSEGVPHKALIDLGGQPILAHVIAALDESGAGRIAVSSNDQVVRALAQDCGASTLEAQTGPSASVAHALDALGTPMLVTTSDHALLQGQWVKDLIADTPPNADLGVMLARRSNIEARLPGTKRTYLKFADGEWSGCNLFYLRTPASRAAIELWQAIEADRKRPWRIAWKLGLGTLLAYAMGRLTLADAIAKLGTRIGIRAVLVPARDGLAAVDVDKSADLELVRKLSQPDRVH